MFWRLYIARLKSGKSDAEGVCSEHVIMASSALANPLACSSHPFFVMVIYPNVFEIVFSSPCLRKMKALKCRTLGGIHIHHALSHIEQQVPRTFHTHNSVQYRQAVYIDTAHARTSASLPRVGFRLYFTPVAPVASL